MKVARQYLYSIILTLGISLAQHGVSLDAESLFKKASPAVVQIAVKSPSGDRMGTGFFVSADGKLVTNNHVIEGATEITILLPSKAQFVVEKTIATDVPSDLAVLKVLGEGLQYLELANDAFPPVGTKVFTIGSPQGLTNTLSEGIISGVRKLATESIVLQVTAPISPGSSGGPLLDITGHVIGVTTTYLIDGQNLNFCIPVTAVRALLQTGQQETSQIKHPDDLDQDNDWVITHLNTYTRFQEFTEKVENSPNDASALLERAEYLLRDGWMAGSNEQSRKFVENMMIQDCTSAIKLNPGNAAGYKLRCEVFLAAKAAKNALFDLERFLKLAEVSAETHLFASEVYQTLEMDPERLEQIELALTADPNSAVAYTQRARYFIQRGNHEKALADCEMIIKFAKKGTADWRVGWTIRASILEARHDFESALSALDTVIHGLKQDSEQDYSTLANYFSRVGDLHVRNSTPHKAIESYTNAIEAKGSAVKDYERKWKEFFGDLFDDAEFESTFFGSYALKRARAKVLLGKDDQAIKDFSCILKVAETPRPRLADGPLIPLPPLVQHEFNTNRVSRAFKMSKATPGEVFQERAWCWYRLGDYNGALDDLMAAAYAGATLDAELIAALRAKRVDLTILEDGEELRKTMSDRQKQRQKVVSTR